MALVLALGLVACGGTGSSSQPASTPASGTDAPEAGSLSGTIRYASMWSETEAQADVIKAAIEDFTALYPDVEITVDWMGRDVRKTIQAGLDAGQSICGILPLTPYCPTTLITATISPN